MYAGTKGHSRTVAILHLFIFVAFDGDGFERIDFFVIKASNIRNIKWERTLLKHFHCLFQDEATYSKMSLKYKRITSNKIVFNETLTFSGKSHLFLRIYIETNVVIQNVYPFISLSLSLSECISNLVMPSN